MRLDVDTPHGPARARVELPPVPATCALVLGHGAGGGIDAADLRAAAGVALELGIAVARVEQPYRVAGRRSPAPARQLDTAWLAVIAALRDGPLAGHALICGGRSSGARVACRTAAASGAAGVLCLAFPLLPPGPARAGDQSKSRLPELASVPTGVPVLVVQGERDPFGMPPPGPDRVVDAVPGTHTLGAAAVMAPIAAWLTVVAFSATGC